MTPVLETFIPFVESLRGHPVAPFVFVVSYTLACLALPIILFPVAGGILFGFWGGLLLNLLSAVAGSCLAFFLARRGGRGRFKWLTTGRMGRMHVRVSKNGFMSVLIMRLVGIPPFHILNYLIGLTGVSFRAFLAATALGVLPWTVLVTYFADALWQILRTSGMPGFYSALSRHGRPLAVAAVALAALAVLHFVWKRRLEKAA